MQTLSEQTAVKDLHRVLAEQITEEAGLFAGFRAAQRENETSDGVPWVAPHPSDRAGFAEELYGQLAAHIPGELGLMESFRQLAEREDLPEEVRYLLRILVTDEEAHHQFFTDMASALGIEVAEHDESAAVDVPEGPPARFLRHVATQFLAAEREDQRQLKALHSELRPLVTSNLWALLIELMRLDNEKHIHLLKYLRHHADQLARADEQQARRSRRKVTPAVATAVGDEFEELDEPVE